MAKPPWVDIVQSQTGNGYAEEVVSDVGEHMRTRPAEGCTPPGGGRPSRESTDNTPLPYHRHEHDEVLGIRDNEELYAPPPPTRPADGATPQQPQEFEAVWMDRYLKRTQGGQPGPETGQKKLILPATYNASSTADNDIEAMQQQMRTMQHALHAAMERKAAEAEQAKAKAAAEPTGGYLQIIVPMPNGEPTATLFVPGKMGQPFDVGAALALLQVLGK